MFSSDISISKSIDDISNECGDDLKFFWNDEDDLYQNTLDDNNGSNRINHIPSRQSELNFQEKNEPNNIGDFKMISELRDDLGVIFNPKISLGINKDHLNDSYSSNLSHQSELNNHLNNESNNIGDITRNQAFSSNPEKMSPQAFNNMDEEQKSEEEEIGKDKTLLSKKRYKFKNKKNKDNEKKLLNGNLHEECEKKEENNRELVYAENVAYNKENDNRIPLNDYKVKPNSTDDKTPSNLINEKEDSKNQREIKIIPVKQNDEIKEKNNNIKDKRIDGFFPKIVNL